MLLKVSKLSKWDKKHWIFKYSNSDFDEIINLIINNLDYDYIELLIWSAELYLFNDIDYILLNDNRKFSTIKIDKSNSIKILEPSIYDEIRHFEIKIFNENNKFKNKMQMPILEDLYNILEQDEKTKRFKTKLIPFVHGSMKFFNNYTNIKYQNLKLHFLQFTI